MVPPLAVDLSDFLSAFVPIAVLIIWVLSQVFGEQAKQARRAKGAGPGGPPQGRKPAAAPKGVAAEIEAFLKRVAEQRGGGKPAEVEVFAPESPPQATARRSAARAPLTPAAESVDQVVEVLSTRHAIADSVHQHLGGGQLAEHAEHLGDEVRDADERLQQRLHATFDHRLGQLEQAETQSPSQGPKVPPGAGLHLGTAQDLLADFFRSPEGMRRAIILSEILKRPEGRW